MRKTERLFEIIQILRSHNHSVTAEALAEELEVSKRTVYRDIQALQAMRTPIDGEAGVGYMMRSGYDLPAINFNANELEAIAVGLKLLARTGDHGLQRAAKSVANKIKPVCKEEETLVVSDWGVELPTGTDLNLLRTAIRDEQKLQIHYRDSNETDSQRCVLPIAMIYYIEVVVLVTWCEVREDFRHFRVDRITDVESLDQHFKSQSKNLRRQWQNLQKD